MERTDEVIKAKLAETGLTQEQFTDLLNERLVGADVISRPALHSWLSGKWQPKLETIFTLFLKYRADGTDWRFLMAVDLLCAKLPEIFVKGEAGELFILQAEKQ